MLRRQRLANGSFGELEKIGSALTIDEQVMSLGAQLAQEKIKNIQKDMLINSLGTTITQLKLEVMEMKGSGE
ncbi:hypothetical protein [Lysinibacillus piscis]|uniref:Bacteriophage SP-beta YorD domain-containing protein n=1 Tax=Lysinibacillus piscis TaxID=2518931 RepID=A0ABQ5NIS2_9BACI|nr:hypothetical protein [Lysinibacillus sp. KH24]GLC88271.1 hypothetical protein LYSBPC_13980 [Lysinibacillus sp. KH24]